MCIIQTHYMSILRGIYYFMVYWIQHKCHYKPPPLVSHEFTATLTPAGLALSVCNVKNSMIRFRIDFFWYHILHHAHLLYNNINIVCALQKVQYKKSEVSYSLTWVE